jgi:hypothetical protein
MLALSEFGVPDLIFLAFGLLVAGSIVGLAKLAHGQRRKAKAYGYASLAAYLRAAPRTDDERRDAVDLALKGVVMCLLGLIFAPLLLVGLIPFFYGTRKLVYGSLGLGLMDDGDAEPPQA